MGMGDGAVRGLIAATATVTLPLAGAWLAGDALARFVALGGW
jgi:hypothetical protein